MWHRIVGLMTLALDSMIEPSQSNAYPEASTILRSIVYSSSKLQGESGWYDQVCRYYTYFWFVPQCSLSVLSCSVLCSAMCSVMRDAVPHAVVLEHVSLYTFEKGSSVLYTLSHFLATSTTFFVWLLYLILCCMRYMLCVALSCIDHVVVIWSDCFGLVAWNDNEWKSQKGGWLRTRRGAPWL